MASAATGGRVATVSAADGGGTAASGETSGGATGIYAAPTVSAASASAAIDRLRGFELRAGSEGLDEGEKIAVVDHATQLQLRRDATRPGIPRTGGGAAEEEEKEKARRRSRASWLIYTLDAVVAVWYEPQPGAAAAGGWMGWVGYSSPSFPTRSVRGVSRGGLAVPLVGYLAL